MKKILFFTISIFIFSNYVIATSGDDLLKSYLRKCKEINTIKVDFVQTNYWPEYEMENVSFGKLYAKGYNIRLDYIKPKNHIMLGTEKELVFYFPEEKQLIGQDSNYWQYFISPEFFADEYVEYCVLDSSMKVKDGYIFLFKPREAMNDLKEIKLRFDSLDSLITNFDYTDRYDNEVRFEFENPIINDSIPDSIFFLKIPEDVNVIDQRLQKEG